MKHKLFVTGIGTGVGKTVVSAVLTQYFKADYWKPVQSGDLDQSDTQSVQQWVSQRQCRFFPETYRFKLAASPHQSAAAEGVTIELERFEIPETANHLIVEGAGGLYVPLSDQFFMVDLIVKLGLAVVLVVRDYLGCINHTLAALEVVNSRKIPLAYVVFNGDFNPHSKRVIAAQLGPETRVFHLAEFKDLTPATVALAAEQLDLND